MKQYLIQCKGTSFSVPNATECSLDFFFSSRYVFDFACGNICLGEFVCVCVCVFVCASVWFITWKSYLISVPFWIYGRNISVIILFRHVSYYYANNPRCNELLSCSIMRYVCDVSLYICFHNSYVDKSLVASEATLCDENTHTHMCGRTKYMRYRSCAVPCGIGTLHRIYWITGTVFDTLRTLRVSK